MCLLQANILDLHYISLLDVVLSRILRDDVPMKPMFMPKLYRMATNNVL